MGIYGVISILFGIGIFIYLELTKRPVIEPPTKRIEQVEYQFRQKQTNKNISGEAVEFEEIK